MKIGHFPKCVRARFCMKSIRISVSLIIPIQNLQTRTHARTRTQMKYSITIKLFRIEIMMKGSLIANRKMVSPWFIPANERCYIALLDWLWCDFNLKKFQSQINWVMDSLTRTLFAPNIDLQISLSLSQEKSEMLKKKLRLSINNRIRGHSFNL